MELFIDLNKGRIDTSKLVRKPVQVHGKNGKMFIRMQWVDPKTGQPVSKEGKPQQPKTGDGGKPPRDPDKGGIDKSKLKEGTNIEDHPELLDKLNESADLLLSRVKGKKLEKPIREVLDKFKPSQVFNGVFQGHSIEGLEHVFSHPDGKYTASMTGADLTINHKGEIGIMADFDLKSKDNKYIGNISREVYRRDNGYHIYNEMFSFYEGTMGKGYAKTMYNRTEEYWKHLANGGQVSVSVLANISVGKYCWAKEGFKFSSDFDREQMANQFIKFCKGNKIDSDKVLEENGYSDVHELSQPIDFASLNDNEIYDLKKLAPMDAKDDIVGQGHLGKAFMLGGCDSWYGTKIITDEE
jgi:hypothetical protein